MAIKEVAMFLKKWNLKTLHHVDMKFGSLDADFVSTKAGIEDEVFISEQVILGLFECLIIVLRWRA